MLVIFLINSNIGSNHLLTVNRRHSPSIPPRRSAESVIADAQRIARAGPSNVASTPPWNILTVGFTVYFTGSVADNGHLFIAYTSREGISTIVF